MKTKAKSRKERERERHRSEILKAAEDVFARKGFYRASISEIAERAEFAVGTIYLHFSTKEEIYKAIIEEKASLLLNRVHELLTSEMDALESIKATVGMAFEFFQKERDFFRIYILERARMEWEFRSDITARTLEIYEKHINIIAKVFREGMKEGLIKKGNARFLAVSLSALINAILADWIASEKPVNLARRERGIWRLFFLGAATDEGRRRVK